MAHTIAHRTRRFYDNISAVYPLSTYFFHSKAHKVALEQAGIQNGMKVLEVASGTGEMFQQLVELNPDGSTVGVDISPNMAAYTLKRARKAAPGVMAHCGAVDVRDLPFRDESFDAVMCCYLLELLGRDDIPRTLREIQRVLRPGGKFTLILIGQNSKRFRQAYEVGCRILPAFWGRLVESTIPEMMRQHGMVLTGDQFVRQGFYPSRVVTGEMRAVATVGAGGSRKSNKARRSA
ncbi:MAG: class I SAM-dependent methyltransferase [Acidobacteriota bacterium]